MNGTNFVVRWNSLDYDNLAQSYAGYRPWLSTETALNGKPTVDFGAPGAGNPYMVFGRGLHSIRSVFMVWLSKKATSNFLLASSAGADNVGQANYSASKGAIEGFTRTLAKESGRKNITVNAILPGCIDTEMMRAVPEANLKAILAGHPMQRLGQPSEVAALVMFLASDESSYISGECIITSGAYIIH